MKIYSTSLAINNLQIQTMSSHQTCKDDRPSRPGLPGGQCAPHTGWSSQQGAARSSVTMNVGVFSTKSPGFPHLLKEADSRMSITENRKKPNRETHQPKYTSKT